MKSNKVYFVSDAHFGIDLPGCEDRERLFFNFLDQEVIGGSELYIVGDLFDFWIEYGHAIRPDYVPVLHHLWKAVDHGVTIHYLAGNHDFALGPFLEKTMGIRIYPGEIAREIQGKRVYLYHGDGLIKRDIGYRVLKKLLRNPINQRIYKLLHPDIGVPLGSFVSGSSRKYLNRPLAEKFREEYRRCAQKELARGHDIVIYGHIHLPELISYPYGVYCNIGSWLKYYTYATMCDGKLLLLRYQEGGDAEVLPGIELR
ncbi:MAG: UDP-2,3-diacylglucosamine diphosphatase [Chitinispirillaceae bacterium]|nr:UDP-2,3-diacylglucosamine diphosphatase [Chitinispirillaceae bacterium]